MFLAFGAAIVLGAFLVVNALVSLAVAALAPSILRALSSTPARDRARVLLGLRLLPASAAAIAAVGLVVPAYLLFEPADAGERVTWPLAVLAVAALAIVLRGLLRGLRALWATAALVQRWMGEAEAVTLPRSPVPVFRIRDALPVFSVVGLRRPRMYVSARVLDALTPDELAAAVAHEQAHLGAADNLKRLLMRSCPDLLVLSRASRAIEAEWGHAAEAAADDQASRGRRETALSLAAGLVKVARLAPSSAAGLPVSALHDGGDVEARVKRLLDGVPADDGSTRGGTGARIAGVTLASLGLAVVGYGLPAVHGLIEVAARLLR